MSLLQGRHVARSVSAPVGPVHLWPHFSRHPDPVSHLHIGPSTMIHDPFQGVGVPAPMDRIGAGTFQDMVD